MRRVIETISATILLAVLVAGPAAAHPHLIDVNPHHEQVLANGQNHPGFEEVNNDGLRLSCEGVLEPADSGPAGYGLETAHHGPDAGTPGKGDRCYATKGDPQDNNPAVS